MALSGVEKHRRHRERYPGGTPRDKYGNHKSSATHRGVAFHLTFDEWFRIWLDSGKWTERGNGRGRYVMARFGDQGAYEPGNVRICTREENVQEKQSGKPLSDAHRAKLKAAIRRTSWPASRSRVFSEEHKARISAGKKGKTPWNKGLRKNA